jgi:hypothetical protein
MLRINSTLTVLFSLLTFSCGSKKKEVEVPQKVKNALLANFPDATNVTWEKETAFEWEADFKMYENKYSANFDPDGNLLVMEYDIEVSYLPAPVIRDIDSSFEGYQIKKAEHAEKGNFQFFEIELIKADKRLEVVYDEKGNMLNNEDRNKEIDSGEKD